MPRSWGCLACKCLGSLPLSLLPSTPPPPPPPAPLAANRTVDSSGTNHGLTQASFRTARSRTTSDSPTGQTGILSWQTRPFSVQMERRSPASSFCLPATSSGGRAEIQSVFPLRCFSSVLSSEECVQCGILPFSALRHSPPPPPYFWLSPPIQVRVQPDRWPRRQLRVLQRAGGGEEVRRAEGELDRHPVP